MTNKTVDEVYEAVLDTKETVLEVRANVQVLKEHVNDRNEAIEANMARIERQAIQKDDLLPELLRKLVDNSRVQWGLGLLGTVVLGFVTSSAWFPLLEGIVRSSFTNISH